MEILRIDRLTVIGFVLAACSITSSAAPPRDWKPPGPLVAETAWRELEKTSRMMDQKLDDGDYAEAIALGRQGQAKAERHLGEEHWYTLKFRQRATEAEAILKLSADERRLLDRIVELRVEFTRLRQNKAFAKAAVLQEQICQHIEGLFGHATYQYAMDVRSLGDILEACQRCDEAEAAYRKALAILLPRTGELNPEYLSTLFRLAFICRLQGKLSEAADLYEVLIRLRLQVYEWDDEDYCTIYSEAALTAMRAKNYDQATSLCRIMIDGLEPELPDRSSEYLEILFLYAMALCGSGRYAEVGPIHDKMWEEWERRGSTTPDAAYCRIAASVADYCVELEDHDLAAQYYSLALAPPALRVKEREWWVLKKRSAAKDALDAGKPQKGRQHLEDIMEEIEENGEPDLMSNFWLSMCWAQLHRLNGDFAGCADSLREAEKLHSQLDGLVLEDSILRERGLLAAAQRDYTGAQILLQRAIASFTKRFGKNNLIHAKCAEELADVLEKSGDVQTAASEFNRALGIRKKAVGNDHPTFANGLLKVARFHGRQGEMQAAKSKLDRAVEIYQKSFSERPKQLAAMLHQCAQVYRETGFEERAVDLESSVDELRTRQIDVDGQAESVPVESQ
jgi:tetratricopeptide (TPR) repeat protein